MEFSEKELVNLAVEEADIIDCSPWSSMRVDMPEKHRKCITTALYCTEPHREYVLDNGRRCDLLYITENKRVIWLIEFKVHADNQTIVQLCDYWTTLKRSVSLKFQTRAVSICAQFYDQETLYFAKKLGIHCMQFAPINRDRASVHEIVRPRASYLTWRHPFWSDY